jgi:hypothetical protein
LSNRSLVLGLVAIVAVALVIGPILTGIGKVLDGAGGLIEGILAGIGSFIGAVAGGITAGTAAAVAMGPLLGTAAASGLAIGGSAAAVYVFHVLAKRHPLESLSGVASIGGGYSASLAEEVSGLTGTSGIALSAFVSLLLFTTGLFIRRGGIWWILAAAMLVALVLVLVVGLALGGRSLDELGGIIGTLELVEVLPVLLLFVAIVAVAIISWFLRDDRTEGNAAGRSPAAPSG